MPDRTEVAIIGAGPYGLSIAAHLSARQIDTRIFGPPMHTWHTAMPRGMKLKSEGFASSLYDPSGVFPLSQYCSEREIAYQDIGQPVSLETFTEYGLEFQARFVPGLDTRMVRALEHNTGGFELVLDDGQQVSARQVIVATGITNFAYTPPEFAHLPPSLLSHSSAHTDVSQVAGGAEGKRIVIIGAGASAIDLAALLNQSDASVTVVARRPAIDYNAPPRPRTVRDHIREPVSGLGTGWRSLICVKAPLVFHYMPESFRLLVVRRHLGPAPGWVVREHVERHVAMKLGATIRGIREARGRAKLTVTIDGQTSTIEADHVVAATGYRADMRRLPFIGPSISRSLRCVEHTPILDGQFQSSVPGLYFTGLAAANSFGPLLRFAYGAGFTARRLARHLHGAGRRRSHQVRIPAVAPATT